MNHKIEIILPKDCKNIEYIEQNHFIYSIDNEIYHHDFSFKSQKVKKISKFCDSVSIIKISHNQSDTESCLFVASDSHTIKLFTLTHNIFTHKSRSRLTDLNLIKNVIIFSTFEGLFIADPMNIIPDDSLKRPDQNNIIQLNNHPVISHGYIPRDINFFSMISNNSNQTIDDIKKHFKKYQTDHIIDNNIFSYQHIIFCTENELFVGSTSINIENLRKIEILQDQLAIILNKSVLLFKFNPNPDIEAYTIPHVNFCHKLDTKTCFVTQNSIYFNEFESHIFNSNILAIFEENDRKIVMTSDNEQHVLMEINGKLHVSEDLHDLSWIFTKPQEDQFTQVIHPNQINNKKSLKYKEPKHPVQILHKFHPLKNELDPLRDAIRMHKWRKFLLLVKTMNIQKSVKFQLLRMFVDKIWRNEPLKVRMNVLKGNENIILDSMDIKLLSNSIGLIDDRFFSNSQNKVFTKKFNRKLKEIMKIKKKTVESMCILDLYANHSVLSHKK